MKQAKADSVCVMFSRQAIDLIYRHAKKGAKA